MQYRTCHCIWMHTININFWPYRTFNPSILNRKHPHPSTRILIMRKWHCNIMHMHSQIATLTLSLSLKVTSSHLIRIEKILKNFTTGISSLSREWLHLWVQSRCRIIMNHDVALSNVIKAISLVAPLKCNDGPKKIISVSDGFRILIQVELCRDLSWGLHCFRCLRTTTVTIDRYI